ncbi:MAG: TRAP transporter substrate-binding protein DctP [Alphaproteobacteria bacterium]
MAREPYYRTLSIAAAIAVTIGSTAAQAAVDGPKLGWNLAAYGPPRPATLALDRLSDVVKAETSGNFAIKVQYSEALAPAKEILDGTSIGAFELGWWVPTYAPGKLPSLTALGLPFLPLGDLMNATRAADAYYRHPVVAREHDVWNVDHIMVVFNPPYEFMGCGKAPDSIAAWKGLRVRALGGGGTAMARLGAVPTTVTSPEVYGAMDRGIVDAAAITYGSFATYKIPEIAHWYTKGFALNYIVTAVVGNKSAHAKLPPQYQALIKNAVPIATQAQAESVQAEEDKAEADFQKRGLKMINISAEMRQEMIRVGGTPVWDDWVKEMTEKGLPARTLLDFLLAEGRKGAS